MNASGQRLQGKVANVTGTGQGIGEAIARAYIREGAKVVLTARTWSKLDEVVSEIGVAGGEALALEAVPGERAGAETTVTQALAAWGRVDVVVNDAHAFNDYLPLEEPKMEANALVDLQSGFIGSLQLMQAALPHVRDAAAVKAVAGSGWH